MKLFFWVLLASIWPLSSMAQNTLTGNVTSEDQSPISANVLLPQLQKGAITNLDGSYSVENIPNGRYIVVISSVGFETISQQLDFRDGATITFNVEMKESIVEMEEIVISTPFHQLQRDNVMKVERVNTKELLKTGAVNLSEGIDNIAGVSSISTGTGIGKPVIRGLSANRVLTYAQGVRLENQQFGDEHGLGVNSAGIGSVEVIKGPASLLYGSDALGGVLYLNPERFAASGNTEVLANGRYFSNTEGFQTTAAVKTSGESLKFLARGTRASFSDYKTGADYRVTNTRYNEYDFKSGVEYQGNRFRSELRYNYNRSNIGIPEEISPSTTSKELELPFQEIDNHIVSLDNRFFLDNSMVSLKAGYLFNDRREFEDSPDVAALRLKLNTFNYDLKYHFPKWGKWETIGGVQGMFQKNENFGEEFLIPNANKVDVGIFATTHYHLDEWDFQGGLRYDFRNISTEAAGDPSEFDYIPSIDKDFGSFNAALGVKYSLQKWTARLNVASGFRAPNLAELTSNGEHEGTNRYEIGNAELANEKNFQTDLALEYRSDHFEVFVNGFHNLVSDYIFIAPTGNTIDDSAVFVYEQSDATLYGGEAGFHWHPHPLDWLHWEGSFEMVTGELNDGGYLPLIPANQVKNTFRFETKDWGFLKRPSGFFTWQHSFDQNNVSTFETPTNGYSLLSLGVGAEVIFKNWQLDWNVNVTNLTDKEYINHLSRLKPDNLLNTGRSINLSLGISI